MSTSIGVPTRPGPDSDGATVETGGVRTGAATTVTAKETEAEPPEFVAVTATVSAARAAPSGIETRPVAGSTEAPAPATPKASAAPAKALTGQLMFVDYGLR